MDWLAKVTEYQENERIQSVFARFSSPQYRPDMSISAEIRTLLTFTSQHNKDRIINGPEDLSTAQQILNELNQYRDRAIEINLSCIGKKTEIDRAYSIIQQIVLLQPEIQGRGTTESIKSAIVGQVAGPIAELQSQWDSLYRQSELLYRNCRSVYDTISLQIEIAKQMWFQDRYSTNLDPRPPTGSEAAMPGASKSSLSSQLNRRA